MQVPSFEHLNLKKMWALEHLQNVKKKKKKKKKCNVVTRTELLGIIFSLVSLPK